MSRTPSWADWIGGYIDDGVAPILSSDTREIENNAAVMAWWLLNSLNWSYASTAVFIGYAWTYANCDSYRGFLTNGQYAPNALIGLGFLDQTRAAAIGLTTGAPATQMFYLCNPQYPDRLWSGPATMSYSRWAGLPNADISGHVDTFYDYWRGIQSFIVDAATYKTQWKARAQWLYDNIDDLKLIDEWPAPSWLLFAFNQKKGGRKLIL